MKKRGWVWWLIGLLALSFLMAPVIISHSLQSRAGKLIRNYVDTLEVSTENSTEGIFYCLLPSLHELPKSRDLDQAIQWLNKAKSIFPPNVYSNILLGQAYCLSQEYQKAGDAFDVFLVRRPDNSLAKVEFGFALFFLGKSEIDPENASTLLSRSQQSLEETGFSTHAINKLGDVAFTQENYWEAIEWYEISNSLNGLEESAFFRFALLQFIEQGHSQYGEQIDDGMILELGDDLLVEPSDLFYLSTGSPIETRLEVNRSIGVLYSNAQDAGILLSTSETRKLCISLQALDREPAPTQIGVDMDFENLSIVELKNGFREWIQYDLTINLHPGVHLLSIKLMNDSNEGGLDRNAYFGSLRIGKCMGD